MEGQKRLTTAQQELWCGLCAQPPRGTLSLTPPPAHPEPLGPLTVGAYADSGAKLDLMGLYLPLIVLLQVLAASPSQANAAGRRGRRLLPAVGRCGLLPCCLEDVPAVAAVAADRAGGGIPAVRATSWGIQREERMPCPNPLFRASG